MRESLPARDLRGDDRDSTPAALSTVGHPGHSHEMRSQPGGDLGHVDLAGGGKSTVLRIKDPGRSSPPFLQRRCAPPACSAPTTAWASRARAWRVGARWSRNGPKNWCGGSRLRNTVTRPDVNRLDPPMVGLTCDDASELGRLRSGCDQGPTIRRKGPANVETLSSARVVRCWAHIVRLSAGSSPACMMGRHFTPHAELSAARTADTGR